MQSLAATESLCGGKRHYLAPPSRTDFAMRQLSWFLVVLASAVFMQPWDSLASQDRSLRIGLVLCAAAIVAAISADKKPDSSGKDRGGAAKQD